VRAGQDIFGQNPQANNSQAYDCVHCQRSFPAQRYAPHLEKCLGLSGRSSSRTASRRMGTGERAGSGSPFTPMSYSDDREASDSDKDLIEKKRKKNASSNNGFAGTNGASGANGGDYGVTGSVKSSSSSTKVKKLKQNDSSEYPAKTQKSSLLVKASKGSSSSKLKGIGLQSPSATPIGEISLGYLDDDLLLANGRSLQNGAGSNNTNGSSTQKLSSSNPKRASGGTGSSKRPPGSSSSKNGQVTSFYESLKAIGSHESASSDSGEDNNRDEDYREDEEKGRRGLGGSTHSSSQSINPVVIRIKKSSAFSGHNSDSVDSEYIVCRFHVIRVLKQYLDDFKVIPNPTLRKTATLTKIILTLPLKAIDIDVFTVLGIKEFTENVMLEKLNLSEN
ncbi:Ataxin-7-like protein 3, partial [Entomortierella beljakovae]